MTKNVKSSRIFSLSLLLLWPFSKMVHDDMVIWMADHPCMTCMHIVCIQQLAFRRILKKIAFQIVFCNKTAELTANHQIQKLFKFGAKNNNNNKVILKIAYALHSRDQKYHAKTAVTLFTSILNRKLPTTNFQLNIFIFEARVSLRTLLQPLKQNGKISAWEGNVPKQSSFTND